MAIVNNKIYLRKKTKMEKKIRNSRNTEELLFIYFWYMVECYGLLLESIP